MTKNMRMAVLFLCAFATPQAWAASVSLAAYNTLNLFDAVHEDGKNDWTFLPASYPGKRKYCETIKNEGYRKECLETDWSQAKVDLKIRQIAKVVKSMPGDRLPDMLALSEVENEYVVGLLAEELGYRDYVVTESPDHRGIDVALLYNTKRGFKYLDHTPHRLPSSDVGKRGTRDILEVEFSLGGESLHVFVNHWPSQAAPAVIRTRVAKRLTGYIDDILADNAKANIIATGDFNVIPGDHPHPFKSVFYANQGPSQLVDVHDLFMRDRDIDRDLKNKMSLGTYFYKPRMDWNRLDRFFINRNLKNQRGAEVNIASYRIHAPSQIRKDLEYNSRKYAHYGTVIKGTPKRYDFNATTAKAAGFSDHFPVYVELTY